MIGSLVRKRGPYGVSAPLDYDPKFVGTVIDRAIADRVVVLWNNGKTQTIDPYYLEIISDSR